MCGLFGFVNYSNKDIKGLSDLTNALAEHASVRGTDATGISFVSGGIIRIIKEAKAANKIDFQHSDNLKALIGHTRHSTQGSEKRNYNNHPFFGKTKNARFSLAHNGVLYNDDELKKKYKLPKTISAVKTAFVCETPDGTRFTIEKSLKNSFRTFFPLQSLSVVLK